jgi:hypothetical protein
VNGAPGEADERRLAVELLAEQAHGLEHVRQPLFRIEHPQALDAGAIAHRRVNHRPLTLRELERRAHRLERQQDVREEDRRVHPEAQRLQRHLDGELGLLANLEQRVLLPEGAVLGHVAAGLAHEPDGRKRGRLAPAGAEEGVVHGPYPTQSRAG